MVRNLLMFICSLGCMIWASVCTATTLAIAEPVCQSRFSEDDVSAVWGALEASVDGGYELISRVALRAMLAEAGVQDTTNLVSRLQATRQALPGMADVDKILVATLGHYGSFNNFEGYNRRVTLALSVIDAKTGKIDAEQRTFQKYDNLDDLYNRLEDTLAQAGLGRPVRQSGRVAILTPWVKATNAPQGLGEAVHDTLESALLADGTKVMALKNVGEILNRLGVGSLSTASPSMFQRIGQELRADALILTVVDSCSVTSSQMTIEMTRQVVTQSTASLAGSVRIINPKTGDLTASLPFNSTVPIAGAVADPAAAVQVALDAVLPSLCGRVAKALSKE